MLGVLKEAPAVPGLSYHPLGPGVGGLEARMARSLRITPCPSTRPEGPWRPAPPSSCPHHGVGGDRARRPLPPPPPPPLTFPPVAAPLRATRLKWSGSDASQSERGSWEGQPIHAE